MAKFKARARTLDMLGRQQIAGAPTALHELFKNAYDAYAENVEVDFFRKLNFVVLRDDGVGMSREEFESRWLTLGTESKLNIPGSDPILPPTGASARSIMGEKGIGRLAIATMGPIVLVATRSEKTLHEVTVSLVPWRVFELPSIDLDEFEVPVESFADDKLDDDVVPFMRDLCLEGIDALKGRVPEPERLSIREEIASFRVPLPRLLGLNVGPSILDGQTGTMFVISPVNENLRADIDEETDSGATNLQKMLLGFSNTMAPKTKVPIETAFRDHLEDGSVYDRIEDQEFFTPEEFEMADHQVRGRFDEKGNFSGTIKIYDADPQELDIVLYRDGRDRACGAFDFDFAYLQGKSSQTSLAPSDYAPLQNKLNEIGGIYIYKDGIRVLPYGDVENDFLAIERRRNKSASYYFFSYRRIFGAISLTGAENPQLREKAGREGFQNNRAYREFRDQLIALFLALAERYFRKDGDLAEEYMGQRSVLEKEYERLERRSKQVTTKRKVFASELEAATAKIDDRSFESDLEEIKSEALGKLSALLADGENPDAEAILKLEAATNNDLEMLKKTLEVSRPRGVGLTKTLASNWERYRSAMSGPVDEAYEATRRTLDERVGVLAKEARVTLDARKRLEAAVDSAMEVADREVKDEVGAARSALEQTKKFVTSELSQARELLLTIRTEVDRAVVDFSSAPEGQDFTDVRSRLEATIREKSDELEARLSDIRSRLQRVSRIDETDDVSTEDTVSAIETELEVVREEYAQAVEMAQLGMAVSIVQHEFASNVKEIRRSLKAMQKWAVRHNELFGLYTGIRDGFDHLDNYLSLFTPLDRRLRRRKAEITGSMVEEFLRNLFGERFDRHDVDFEVTDAARNFGVESYASVILPAFVNLVDNAVHWLSRKDGSRRIVLDATQRGFELTDNGPGVARQLQDAIFEFNFSTKIGGRGMGLYIARTTLEREGIDLYLDREYASGARFVLDIREKDDRPDE